MHSDSFSVLRSMSLGVGGSKLVLGKLENADITPIETLDVDTVEGGDSSV